MGFSTQKTTQPDHRGERVAAWVEDYIRVQRCSVSEVAFRIQQDKRDLQRLIDTRSCGHRLEDALAAYFGWPMVEAVMAPIIDSAIGVEIAKEVAEISAREDRLRHLLRASQGHRTTPRLVHPEDGAASAPRRIEP